MQDDRRKELWNAIMVAGYAEKYEKVPEWAEAFKYYWAITGDHNLKMGCSACYRKIKEWLQR